MKGRLLLLLALPILVVFGFEPIWPAWAGPQPECDVAHRQNEIDFPLPRTAQAIAAKRLPILVVGAGSSQLPGAAAKNAYPARLQQVLAAKLPGVEVKVATDVKATRTAAEMVRTLPPALAGAKPALMVWQTATVDAHAGRGSGPFQSDAGKRH